MKNNKLFKEGFNKGRESAIKCILLAKEKLENLEKIEKLKLTIPQDLYADFIESPSVENCYNVARYLGYNEALESVKKALGYCK